MRSIRPPASAAPIITKPNSPPGPSRSDISAAARDGRPKRAPESEQRQALHRDQRGRETKNEAGPREDERRIDRGADRDEVEPEQEAPERLDRHLDLAPIFGLGQQKPGDEGAERHRQMARRRGQPVAEHHQQARRHEELRALRLRHEMEERPQREAAEDRSARSAPSAAGASVREELPCQSALARRPRMRRPSRAAARPRDPETAAPRNSPGRRRNEPAALDQHRDDDRRRGHRQRRPDRERRGGLRPRPPGGGGEDQRRHDDLPEAQPEHQPAHAPQALERQFEPHREQERDDAEGGDAIDRLDIDRKRAEPRRLCAIAPRP